MNAKDKKIIEDAEKNNIPIFVLTAKDVLSSNTIEFYGSICAEWGCDDKHRAGVYDRLIEFQNWQRKNQDKTDLPD